MFRLQLEKKSVEFQAKISRILSKIANKTLTEKVDKIQYNTK